VECPRLPVIPLPSLATRSERAPEAKTGDAFLEDIRSFMTKKNDLVVSMFPVHAIISSVDVVPNTNIRNGVHDLHDTQDNAEAHPASQYLRILYCYIYWEDFENT
jgi:hypothetical protein